MRVAWLLPDIDSGADLIRAVAPPLAAATLNRPLATASATRAEHGRQGRSKPVAVASDRAAERTSSNSAVPTRIAVAVDATVPSGQAVAVADPDRKAEGAIVAPVGSTPPPSATARLSGSAWLLARGGSGGTLTGGRLGGSQAGARLTYALDHGRRIAIAARVASPLQGQGREAAIGVEWRPAALPVRLVAEQRVSLDSGRGGPTLLAIGGFGPVPVAAGFRLEAYAQAGAVARGQVEGFADGAARATRVVAALGRARIDLGGGAWGAVQRDAGRFDIGPTLGMGVPVAGRSLRMTLDWRQRVVGEARPGSGPALSVGTDF